MKYSTTHCGRQKSNMEQINFKEYLDSKKRSYKIHDPNFNIKVSKLLVSNNNFGQSLIVKDNEIFIEKSAINVFDKRLDIFCRNYNKTAEEKTEYLLKTLNEIFPKTTFFFKRYTKSFGIDSDITLQLLDFILFFLAGELHESTDQEIASLVDSAFDELQHGVGDILADFINYVHDNTKTIYKNRYYMNNYTDNSDKNSAYDPDHYLKILYHLYNKDYIEDNDMYALAARSKKYTDTWLFLSMHFLCALRNTDLVRIPHPRLTLAPKDILAQVESGTFSEADARATIYSVLYELEAFRPTPHKTQGTSGVASIKLHIPESVETHIGTLFALAEAHFQLSKSDPNKPLIKVITTYSEINRYMGEEIGELFLESDFRARAANKSYMQMIYILTDDILNANDEFKVKGYMLAALARSHKGTYGEFAQTTSTYLKDAKMSGYTPEFVAKELFERGVLSVIPSMLLKMVAGDEYKKLSVKGQTKMIQALNMSPLEVESTISAMQKNINHSTEIVKSIYKDHSKEDILKILHRIGNGEAVSKTNSCMCLITAMGKVCPYPGHSNCPSCEYELSTKTTMFLMVREVKRLQGIYKATNNMIEKGRCKAIATDIVAPRIEEMLKVMEETYGSEAVVTLEEIIRQANNG